ncbi:MAG: NTP transferase domain-containing protein [Thermoguttaceae bacterium]|nr:NTP transferase domain-containing protein [Thermoguttaceae bacterium]
MEKRQAVVMAAGKGTRMKSDLPKVLYPVFGKPIIDYVLDALEKAGVGRVIVVVGYRGEMVREALAGRKNVEFAVQAEQLGTGHAVMCCRGALENSEGSVFVIAGDSPMLDAETVGELFRIYEADAARGKPVSALLGTVVKEDPAGMGRILRDADGEFIGIIEDKDASDEQKKITEINMSYYLFNTRDLLDSLSEIKANNAQKEYYITDVPAILLGKGKRVKAVPVLKPSECLGVNTVDDVRRVEEAIAARRES